MLVNSYITKLYIVCEGILSSDPDLVVVGEPMLYYPKACVPLTASLGITMNRFCKNDPDENEIGRS